jgi:hypothetical protein
MARIARYWAGDSVPNFQDRTGSSTPASGAGQPLEGRRRAVDDHQAVAVKASGTSPGAARPLAAPQSLGRRERREPVTVQKLEFRRRIGGGGNDSRNQFAYRPSLPLQAGAIICLGKAVLMGASEAGRAEQFDAENLTFSRPGACDRAT